MPRFLRGLLLTISLYNLLIWGYIVARIILNDVNPFDPFIDGIPISFYVLGIVSFVLSFAFMVLYVITGHLSASTQTSRKI